MEFSEDDVEANKAAIVRYLKSTESPPSSPEASTKKPAIEVTTSNPLRQMSTSFDSATVRNIVFNVKQSPVIQRMLDTLEAYRQMLATAYALNGRRKNKRIPWNKLRAHLLVNFPAEQLEEHEKSVKDYVLLAEAAEQNAATMALMVQFESAAETFFDVKKAEVEPQLTNLQRAINALEVRWPVGKHFNWKQAKKYLLRELELDRPTVKTLKPEILTFIKQRRRQTSQRIKENKQKKKKKKKLGKTRQQKQKAKKQTRKKKAPVTNKATMPTGQENEQPCPSAWVWDVDQIEQVFCE